MFVFIALKCALSDKKGDIMETLSLEIFLFSSTTEKEFRLILIHKLKSIWKWKFGLKWVIEACSFVA